MDSDGIRKGIHKNESRGNLIGMKWMYLNDNCVYCCNVGIQGWIQGKELEKGVQEIDLEMNLIRNWMN